MATATGLTTVKLCTNMLITGNELVAKKLEFKAEFSKFKDLPENAAKSWQSVLEPHFLRESVAADMLDGHRLDLTIDPFWGEFLSSGHRVAKPLDSKAAEWLETATTSRAALSKKPLRKFHETFQSLKWTLSFSSKSDDSRGACENGAG